jgi:hypothetical protein
MTKTKMQGIIKLGGHYVPPYQKQKTHTYYISKIIIESIWAQINSV